MKSILIDMTGVVAGRLLVQGRAENSKHGHIKWSCLCTCGCRVDVAGQSLRNGETKSCGCIRKELMQAKATDLRGRRFGRLLAQDRVTAPRPTYLCLCDCGKTKVIPSTQLLAGRTNSCGCLLSEIVKKLHTKHGKSNTTEFRIWAGMIARCYTPSATGYKNYGGRGITVCQHWRDAFAGFYADMGPRPKGMSLDRINPNSAYTPENCKWSTALEQANNKTDNHFVEAYGQRKTISQWARELDVNRRDLNGAVLKGESIECYVARIKIKLQDIACAF